MDRACGRRSSRSTTTCTATCAQAPESTARMKVPRAASPRTCSATCGRRSGRTSTPISSPIRGGLARRHEGLEEKKLDAKGMVKIGEGFFTSAGPHAACRHLLGALDVPRSPRTVRWSATRAPGTWPTYAKATTCASRCASRSTRTTSSPSTTSSGTTTTYYYYKLPVLFQQGANDGFHEGIGDTLALSSRPATSTDLGMLDKAAPSNEKAEINVLMGRARQGRVPALRPHRQVALGRVLGQDAARRVQQGLVGSAPQVPGHRPPVAALRGRLRPGRQVPRPRERAVPRYFLAHPVQFQFHRALCKAVRLHRAAPHLLHLRRRRRAKLAAMLSMGASQALARGHEGALGRVEGRRGCPDRVLRAAASLAQGAEQGPEVRVVGPWLALQRSTRTSPAPIRAATPT
jgi:peptidyl-dipeptidase A